MTTSAKDPYTGHAFPLASRFVRHRQPRQAEGGAVWKAACRACHQGGEPVATATFWRATTRMSPSIAARLPVGRVHATGRTFVPFIRRDLYDKLVAAAANGQRPLNKPAERAPQVRRGQRLAARRPICRGIGKRLASAISLSRNEIREEGWYEAIVVRSRRRHADITLARLPARTASCGIGFGLACCTRTPNPTAETGKASKGVAATKARQNSRGKSWRQHANPCRKIGDEIDINHLVLAKDDSPWGAWWEAIPVEKAGDGSSFAGATTTPTFRRLPGRGSTWR